MIFSTTAVFIVVFLHSLLRKKTEKNQPQHAFLYRTSVSYVKRKQKTAVALKPDVNSQPLPATELYR
jgi:hypothetical protein